MPDKERKYKFSWKDTVGADMNAARPSLGPNTRIEVYRLFQFTLRDILEQHYGTEMADTLFREAGALAGRSFFEQYLSDAKDVSSLAAKIRDSFSEFGMGIFRVEEAAPDNGHFIFTIDEDLDCSGLPDTADVICVYDEGFIQGILESFSGRGFDVREIDCWCTGSRTCRFEAKNRV
ncbi:4-vinyl reductase [Brucepastera parasyntrophica]|uniref:V4R domain-containing protein n=1 Tax=Brucepastera parasyntrophica TaxID=2880008 RepID=UPI00210DBA10|nr:V4R domain-containing protein [Brucepastera parasyntrophica]ULQ60235.1 4-vinyl reductase [Brucepastera parasyntrophica]